MLVLSDDFACRLVLAFVLAWCWLWQMMLISQWVTGSVRAIPSVGCRYARKGPHCRSREW
jgi:hypothetical protein